MNNMNDDEKSNEQKLEETAHLNFSVPPEAKYDRNHLVTLYLDNKKNIETLEAVYSLFNKKKNEFFKDKTNFDEVLRLMIMGNTCTISKYYSKAIKFNKKSHFTFESLMAASKSISDGIQNANMIIEIIAAGDKHEQQHCDETCVEPNEENRNENRAEETVESDENGSHTEVVIINPSVGIDDDEEPLENEKEELIETNKDSVEENKTENIVDVEGEDNVLTDKEKEEKEKEEETTTKMGRIVKSNTYLKGLAKICQGSYKKLIKMSLGSYEMPQFNIDLESYDLILEQLFITFFSFVICRKEECKKMTTFAYYHRLIGAETRLSYSKWLELEYEEVDSDHEEVLQMIQDVEFYNEQIEQLGYDMETGFRYIHFFILLESNPNFHEKLGFSIDELFAMIEDFSNCKKYSDFEELYKNEDGSTGNNKSRCLEVDFLFE